MKKSLCVSKISGKSVISELKINIKNNRNTKIKKGGRKREKKETVTFRRDLFLFMILECVRGSFFEK